MRTLALSMIATAMLAACSSGPQVRADKDPSVDLTTFKTFAFFESPATDRQGYTSIVTQRLKHATREQLEARGYAYSERQPQLRVNFIVQVADRQELRSAPGIVGPRGYRGWSSGLETVSYREGTLRIDVVDADRHALVWQGVAEGRLDTRADKQPAVEAVVAEVLARFPEHAGR